MLRVGLIVGSTRPNRFADKVWPWIVEGASKRRDIDIEVLDLREANLPFVREPVPPGLSGGVFTAPEAESWRARIGTFDAFVATVAEYNHAPTAVLKNAFDSALNEWRRKPIAFVGYGGVGAARAIEILRCVVVGLQMAPVNREVNIAMEPFIGVAQQGRSLSDYEHLVQSRNAMLDDLEWWGGALSAARGEPAKHAAREAASVAHREHERA